MKLVVLAVRVAQRQVQVVVAALRVLDGVHDRRINAWRLLRDEKHMLGMGALGSGR